MVSPFLYSKSSANLHVNQKYRIQLILLIVKPVFSKDTPI